MTEQFADLGGTRCVEARVVVPRQGAPHADITIEKEIAIASSGLSLRLSGLVLTCAPWRTPVAFQGKMRVRLIGGHGGWRKVIASASYRSPAGVKLSLVLGEAAKACGESIIVGTDRTLGDHYIRPEDAAQRILNRAAPEWHIGLDGVTRTDARASSPILSTFSLLGFDGVAGRALIATEVPADWIPGRTFRSPLIGGELVVDSVIHTMSKGALRTEVLVA